MILLLDLVRRESKQLRQEIFITAAVSGLANAAILSIINVAGQAPRQDVDPLQLAGFVIAMMLYITGLRSSVAAMSRISLEVVHGIRLRLAEKIQSAELETLERIGKAPILNALTHETATLGEAGEVMTAALQSTVLLVFSAMYVAALSLPAFGVVALFAAAGAFVLMRHRGLTNALFRRATEAEVEFVNRVGHVVDGFKEAKLNDRVRDGLQFDLTRTSSRLNELKIAIRDLLQGDTITARTLLYLLIGAIVFLLPARRGVTAEVTTAILFIVGPLTGLATLTPQLVRCNAAAKTILEVEEDLDREHAAPEPVAPPDPPAAFQAITLDSIVFHHHTAANETFVLGPVSLEVRRGEMLFLVGGNGSGKSTLLKVLTGLYRADSGEIRVDGLLVDDLGAYREHFSTVFTDFHLFERLYGLLGVNSVRVRELLALMRLERKTAFAAGRFTNRRLSTGQKKRLAMIVAMLEERPVLIFDEPAADQDPEFRRFLYEQLFPRLRDEGRAVIVVTHDDHYFHLADRVIRMEYGQIACTTAEPAPRS